jgi:hypothetical protein
MLSFSSTPNSQSTITQAFSLENNFSAYQGDSLDFYNTDFQSGATRSRYKLADERSAKKEEPNSSYTEPWIRKY